MRFTLVKDLKKESSMRWILNLLLLFSSLYILVDVFVKGMSLGLSNSKIKETLFGNEEEFLDPMTEASFLEFIHMDIFFIMMLLLTLSAIFIRLFAKSTFNLIILNVVMISALLSLLSLGLSFYFWPSLVWLYLITFFLWHILTLYMSLGSLWKLNA